MRLRPRVRLAAYAVVAGGVALAPQLALLALAAPLVLVMLAPLFPIFAGANWAAALLAIGDGQPGSPLRAPREAPRAPSRLTSHAAAAAAFLSASLYARHWVIEHQPSLFNHFIYVTLGYPHDAAYDPGLGQRFYRWLFGLNPIGFSGYSLGRWDDEVIGVILTCFAVGVFEAAVAFALWRFPGWIAADTKPQAED